MGAALEYELNDFPLLPGGPPLWAEVPVNVVHLDVLVRSLPTALISLAGTGVRAVAICVDGELVDALHVDGQGNRRGATASRALLSASEGTVSAIEIDDAMADALPLLWRSRVLFRDVDRRWIHVDTAVDLLLDDGADRALIVATSSAVGVVLIRHGTVVAAYTGADPAAPASLEGILALLSGDAPGTVTVLEGLPDIATDASLLLGEDAAETAADPSRIAGPDVATAVSEDQDQAEDEGQAGSSPLPPLDQQHLAAPAPSPPVVPPPVAAPIAAAPRGESARPAPSLLDAFAPRMQSPPPPPSRPSSASLLSMFASSGPQAASSVPHDAPPEDDMVSLRAELHLIARRFLGEDADLLSDRLAALEPPVPTLRRGISELREVDLPHHSQAQVGEMTRAMLRAVAERLLAT